MSDKAWEVAAEALEIATDNWDVDFPHRTKMPWSEYAARAILEALVVDPDQRADEIHQGERNRLAAMAQRMILDAGMFHDPWTDDLVAAIARGEATS